MPELQCGFTTALKHHLQVAEAMNTMLEEFARVEATGCLAAMHELLPGHRISFQDHRGMLGGYFTIKPPAGPANVDCFSEYEIIDPEPLGPLEAIAGPAFVGHAERILDILSRFEAATGKYIGSLALPDTGPVAPDHAVVESTEGGTQ